MLKPLSITKARSSSTPLSTVQLPLTAPPIVSSDDINALNQSILLNEQEVKKIDEKVKRHSLKTFSLHDKIDENISNHYWSKHSRIQSEKLPSSSSSWYSLAMKRKHRLMHYRSMHKKHHMKTLNSNDNCEISLCDTDFRLQSFNNNNNRGESGVQSMEIAMQKQEQYHHKAIKCPPIKGTRSMDSLMTDNWNKRTDAVQSFDSGERKSSTKICTIHFWNGSEIKVHPSTPETLDDVIRSHLSDFTIPIQCIDLISKELIPWGTPMSNLASKTLLIKKIHRNRSSFTLQYPGNPKKLERRSAPPLDTSDALKQWFNFHKKNNSVNPQSLSDQLVYECLNELDQNRVEQIFPRRHKTSNCSSPSLAVSNTTTAVSATPPITMTTIDEITRNKSNSFSRIESGSHWMSFSQNFDSQELADVFSIEESWTQIVKSSAKMTRQQQKRQSAIWEFIHTEANYLKYLRTIIDYYLSPFLEIHEHLFDNLDVGWIFSNIEEIYKANIKLWLQHLVVPLKEARQTGHAFTPVIFKSAITHIPDLFSVYKQYYVNLPRCRSYTQEAIRQSTNFCTFLEWADQQGHDHREPLWDQMTKPTARLTQYRLLMESILKNCSNPTEEQEVSEMLKSISEFIETINRQMTETKTWESLEILASKLICDDLLEAVVEDYTQLINDHTNFKFSILGPIKLPLPVVLFHDNNNNQNFSLSTKSLTSLRNRRSSGSSLINFSSNLEVKNVQSRSTASCNRSDSGIGDCNPPVSASTISTDLTSPIYFKQSSRNFSLPNQITEMYQCPVLLSRVTPSSIQKSYFLETDMNDSIICDWSDFYCRRAVQRAVLYGGNLRFKEPPSRSVETVCHILTDLFLITKHHKKDGNDYWKLLKNPVRLDKLVIQRSRDSGVFGCAVLDDFHNISNLYIFSAGVKCDEWIAQLESAKENYRRLMEPEILIAQPFSVDQRYDSSANLVSTDLAFTSENPLNIRQTTTQSSTPCTADGNSNSVNMETTKRNTFFSSQSYLSEDTICNSIPNNNTDDMMSISDKRVRSVTSPASIKSNDPYSSSRSYKDSSLKSSPIKMTNSTSERNLAYHINGDRCGLTTLNNTVGVTTIGVSLDEKSKSTSLSPLRKEKNASVHYHHDKQQCLPPIHRNEPRGQQDTKLKLTTPDIEKAVNIINVRQPLLSSSILTDDSRKSVKMNFPLSTSNRQEQIKYSSIADKSLESKSLSEIAVKASINRPSILIYKIQSDSSDTNICTTHLNPIGLRRQTVHQSLLSIERSDSSDDQIINY